MKKMIGSREMWDAQEVADYVGLNLDWARRQVRQGKLPGIRLGLGGKMWVLPADVEKYLNKELPWQNPSPTPTLFLKVHDLSVEGKIDRLCKVVQEAGAEGITKTNLGLKAYWFNALTRAIAIDELVQKGEIRITTIPGKYKTAHIYTHSSFDGANNE